MKKYTFIFLCAALLLMPFAQGATPAVPELKVPAAAESGFVPELRKFLAALKVIRQYYVDQEKVTYKKLFELALRGLLRELDPYSTFESAADLKATREQSRGERVGIGVTVVLKHGTLEVIATHPEGPAHQAGIRAGDMILKVDGEPTSGKTLNDASGLLQGEPGESVLLEVYRPSADAHMNLTVSRAKLRVYSVTGVQILPQTGNVGYLRITQFGQRTVAELDEALETLSNRNMQMLVIDLRGNPGGLVLSAVRVCDRFIPPQKTVVTLHGRENKELKRYLSAPCKKHYPDLPVVLLVNPFTASAAEIVTACLRDYKRAVVIGEQTFGKGVIQTLIPFGKDEALRITTATYYSPLKHAIHGKGITPDIVISYSPARRLTLQNQLNLYPGVIAPPVRGAVRDVQLERAVEILKAVRLFREAHQQ